MSWGDGFVVTGTVIKSWAISDPRPFFDTLLTKRLKDLVVRPPHYYRPPSPSRARLPPGGVLRV